MTALHWSSQGISTADPADITATMLGLTALTAWSRLVWLWGRRIWGRSRPSLSLISSNLEQDHVRLFCQLHSPGLHGRVAFAGTGIAGRKSHYI